MDGVALVVGEALVDVVEAADGSVVERPGGSATNAAVALSRLLRPVLLATSYGPDERGRLLSEHLVASGVVLATEPARRPAHVGGPGQDRCERCGVVRLRRGRGGWGPVTVADVEVLHVCSLAPLLEPGAAVVAELVERLAPTSAVSYDLNIRPAITGTGPEVVARVNASGGAGRPGQGVGRGLGCVVAGSRRGPRDRSTCERSVPATWW